MYSIHNKYITSIVTLLLLLLLLSSGSRLHVKACSSRAVPKPRPSVPATSSIEGTALPPATLDTASTIRIITTTAATTTTRTTTAAPTTTSSTTPRPNITFPTYKCPETFDAWYCLNDATCFAVKIGDLPVYSCECANGFMGQRCEYKEIDGSYLPKRPRPILEKASIASGATCALILLLFICLTLYLRYDQKGRNLEAYYEDADEEDYIGEPCNCCCCCCNESTIATAAMTVENGNESNNNSISSRNILLAVGGLGLKLNYRQRLKHAIWSFTFSRRSAKI